MFHIGIIYKTINVKDYTTHTLFETIRDEISEGGVIICDMEDVEIEMKTIEYFYEYLDDGNSKYFLVVTVTPFYFEKRFPYVNKRLICFISNYDSESTNIENIKFKERLSSYIGLQSLNSGLCVMLHSVIYILYTQYSLLNSKSFSVIKENRFGVNNKYSSPLGEIIITENLLIKQPVYILQHSQNEKYNILVEGSEFLIPYPFSVSKNKGIYRCNFENEKVEKESIKIALLHPFTGKYREKYLDIPVIFLNAIEYINLNNKDNISYFAYFYDTTDELDYMKEMIEKARSKNVEVIFGGYPYLFFVKYIS